jgi:hypothetical protein
LLLLSGCGSPRLAGGAVEAAITAQNADDILE